MPAFLVRLMGDKLDHVVRSQRVSNKALRQATGWQPRYPSVWEGIPAVVEAARNGSSPTNDPDDTLAEVSRGHRREEG